MRTTTPQKGLGTAVESALTRMGITGERVERWLGRPCHCKARRDKLNRLSAWAARVLSGSVEGVVAAEQLEEFVK